MIRPVAVGVSLLGTSLTLPQRGIIAWFGIRGLGSIYYLSYAIAHGLEEPYASHLSGLVLAVVATSVIVHGISVTPIMNRYQRQAAASAATEAEPPPGRALKAV